MATIDIQGVKELKADFRRIVRQVGTTGMRRATRAGGKIIVNEARRLAPRGGRGSKRITAGGKRKPRLRGSIRVVNVKGAAGEVREAVVHIGWLRTAFHGRFIHGGAKAHRIPKRRLRKKAMRFDGRFTKFAKVVRHPGIAANPFLEKAFAAKHGEASRVMRATFSDIIRRAAGGTA